MESISNSFYRLAVWCLVMTFIVIIAGAVVRATGSGMGCPDWPKCFGQWVPPTDVSELPANYQEIYKDRGYADTSFNVYHTWTEYVNRLSGALLGIMLFVLCLRALKYRKTHGFIVVLCFGIFFLTAFQGWVGATVVSSNLAPYKITVHMLIALVIVFLEIYLLTRIKPGKDIIEVPQGVKMSGYVLLVLILIQILLGTQVRENVDQVNKMMSGMERETWIDKLGVFFYIHRTYSIVLLGYSVYFAVKVVKTVSGNIEYKAGVLVLMSLLVLEAMTGVILNYFALPGLIQPIHLLLAAVIFSFLSFLLLFPGTRKTIG